MAKGKEDIGIEAYLDYFDVMLHGTEDQKTKQSFELLDVKGQGILYLEEFRNIVHSFAQMWSAALGYPIPLNKRYIAKIF